MKVLLINGSPNKHGCTFTALSEIEKVLHKHQLETEILYLGTKAIPGCIACRKCAETGRCSFDDGVNQLLDRIDDFDAMIVGSPVHYAAPSGQIVSFLDRLFYAGGQHMGGKPAAAVVSSRRGGSSAAFDQLNKYFSLSNMPIVTSQYWNMVHGSVPEDVRKDEEGLQTMRTLGENMAWLLRSIEAGRKAGVPAPVYEEKKMRTSFIR